MRKYPLTTAGVTGAVLWGIGDVTAQRFEAQRAKKKTGEQREFDRMRLCGSITHGWIVSGVGNHLWYNQLDLIVRNVLRLTPGSAKFVGAKVALELSLFSPMALLSYWWIVGAFQGESASSIVQELRSNFLGTWVGDATLWAPVEVLFFWKVTVTLASKPYLNLG